MSDRYQIDVDAYHHQVRTGPCFICQIVGGNPDYPAHIVYQDDDVIALLDKYPIFFGHTLVAPREHRVHVTGDFGLDAYLSLQNAFYHVAEALRQEVEHERMYILVLGSNQGNAHVHWHLVPLPPGVPYEEQQLKALRRSELGVLKVSEAEMSSLAVRIRSRLEQ
jgi:ATP adenylyltransferase